MLVQLLSRTERPTKLQHARYFKHDLHEKRSAGTPQFPPYYTCAGARVSIIRVTFGAPQEGYFRMPLHLTEVVMQHPFRLRLEDPRPVVADGAMGTQLYAL